jgi:hypothetical protein
MTRARELYGQGLALARATADPRSESIHLANLAALSHELGQLETALELQRQVLELVRTVGDRRLEATVLDNFALFHNDAGRYEQARELYEEALRGTASPAPVDPRGSVSAIWVSFMRKGGTRRTALEYWDRALLVQRELGRPHRRGNRPAPESGCSAPPRLSREADEAYREAKWLLRETGSAQELGLSLCGRGHLALAREEDASTFLMRAEDIAESLRSTPRSDLRHAIRSAAPGDRRLGGRAFTRLWGVSRKTVLSETAARPSLAWHEPRKFCKQGHNLTPALHETFSCRCRALGSPGRGDLTDSWRFTTGRPSLAWNSLPSRPECSGAPVVRIGPIKSSERELAPGERT